MVFSVSAFLFVLFCLISPSLLLPLLILGLEGGAGLIHLAVRKDLGLTVQGRCAALGCLLYPTASPASAVITSARETRRCGLTPANPIHHTSSVLKDSHLSGRDPPSTPQIQCGFISTASL